MHVAHVLRHVAGLRGPTWRQQQGPADAAEVLSTFARFTTAVDGGIRVRHRQPVELNHVEAHLLDLVAELYPDIFAELERFFVHHQDFLEPTVVRDSFDLALASKLVAAGQSVVTNDLTVTDPERILVMSGPNQGGKTTFARMVGQLHHLACIGCLVPGTTARLQLCNRILTQFEGRGRGPVVSKTTSDSLVILNEVFSSTFLDELASYGPSIVAGVAPEDPAIRCFVNRPTVTVCLRTLPGSRCFPV